MNHGSFPQRRGYRCGQLASFGIARARAARLTCPSCMRPIGATAVNIAAKLQDERNAEYVRGLNLKKNECAEITFGNLLPVVCPHCQTAHEFDLDDIGIGPV